MTTLKRVIFLGPPGAGKGTQAALLAQELGVSHIASGDLFRMHLERGTELGRRAQPYVEVGNLVPDHLTIQMVLEQIDRVDGHGAFILDGFPRNLEQARALDRALEQRGMAIERVFLISVTPEELVRRLGGRVVCRRCQRPYYLQAPAQPPGGGCLACGGELYQRPDDTPEAVRQRIKVYSTQTTSLVEYYRKQGKLTEIDGEQGIQAVAAALRAALED